MNIVIIKEQVIEQVAKEFGFALKTEQKGAIASFIQGNDVFCCLPTGFGKSLCYSLLPKIYDSIRNLAGTSIVVCVSPLVALMIDQKEKFTSMGINTDFIAKAHHDLNTVQGIKDGTSQLVFISPESLLNNTQ